MITGFRTTVCVNTAYDLSKRSYDMNNNCTACAPRNAGCYTWSTTNLGTCRVQSRLQVLRTRYSAVQHSMHAKSVGGSMGPGGQPADRDRGDATPGGLFGVCPWTQTQVDIPKQGDVRCGCCHGSSRGGGRGRSHPCAVRTPGKPS